LLKVIHGIALCQDLQDTLISRGDSKPLNRLQYATISYTIGRGCLIPDKTLQLGIRKINQTTSLMVAKRTHSGA
jgi:hypothetical protein